MNGVEAVISRSYDRIGWRLFMRKNEDNKLYHPSKINIEWKECHEHDSVTEFLHFREIKQYDSTDKQSALYGENEALKREVKFLQEQINMILKLRCT